MSTAEKPIRPTYYVRHPDGTFSIAEPQPSPDDIEAQRGTTYALCDRAHSGSCCEDPDCYRAQPAGQAEMVCAEAYQVVGSLLSDVGQFDTELGGKILDNLSQARMVHNDVLPWPSFEPAADGAQRVDRMSEEQMTCVNTPMDEFEDAIRRVGVVAACEWFGHHSDSEFTKETIRVLAQRATPTPEAS